MSDLTAPKCKECPHFKITAEPWPKVDFGQAYCEKFDMVAQFLDRRKLNKLECVNPKEREDND